MMKNTKKSLNKYEEAVGSAHARYNALQQGNGKSEQVTGNWSEASWIQQGSKNEVRLNGESS